MDGSIFIVLILAMIPVTFLVIQHEKSKVEAYIKEKYGAISDLNIKWSLLGPLAPGDNNAKYKVQFTDLEGNYREIYAITSLFGSVFIRE